MQKYNIATAILYGILFIDTARRLTITQGDHVQAIGCNSKRHQNVRDLLRPSRPDAPYQSAYPASNKRCCGFF